MELQELRKKIAESPNKEWFNKKEENFSFSYKMMDGSRKKFMSTSNRITRK